MTLETPRKHLATASSFVVGRVHTAVKPAEGAGAKDSDNGREEASPDLVEKVSKGLSLVVGLAAFMYVTGAAVLAVRLDKAGLPASEVVTGLPRELLFGVGLQYVVAPAVALALVAALELHVLQLWGRKNDWGLGDLAAALAVGLVLTAIIVWGLLVLQRGDWLLIWQVGELWSTSGWWVAFLAAYVTTLVIYTVAKHHFKLQGFALVALVLFGVGLVAALTRVVHERANLNLEEATVCVNDGGRYYQGLLIGETDNAVYLGRVLGDEKLIFAIPKGRVAELQIGDKAHPENCYPPPQEDQGQRGT